MKIIYQLRHIRKFSKPVVAIGVFDGLHLGHRFILQEAVRTARRIKGTSIALTFSPHPQKENSIYSLRHRLRVMGEVGIDVCIVVNFDKKFARLNAEDFVRNILVKKIGVRHVFVGKNFRFGKGAKGDISTLKKLAAVYNFNLKFFNVIIRGKKAVSSTYIRSLIIKGKLAAAEKLLLRPVSVLGKVIKGTSLGRRLGFPTANIKPHHEILPAPGIYAVKVILGNDFLYGACYIGSKPTFPGKKSLTGSPKYIAKHKDKAVEVYIFDFSRNIYGKYLEIQFIKKIRNEQKFPSPQALACQIKLDVLKVKKLIPRHRSLPQYIRPI